MQLSIGTDFPVSDYLSRTTAQRTESSVASPTPITTVAATASGTQAPIPQNLTHMTATDTPCVK